MYSTPLCVIVKIQEQWGELTRGKMVECGSWSVDFHDRYLFLFFKGHLGSTVVETLTTWSMATGRTQRLGIMRQASHTCIWFWLQIHRIDWEQKDTHLANNSWWLLSGLPQAPETEPVRNTFFICFWWCGFNTFSRDIKGRPLVLAAAGGILLPQEIGKFSHFFGPCSKFNFSRRVSAWPC